MELTLQEINWLIDGVGEVTQNVEYMVEISDNPEPHRNDLKGLGKLKTKLETEKQRYFQRANRGTAR